jgi:hypothetical protein
VRESDDGACGQLTLKQLLRNYVEQGLDAKPKPSDQKRSAATLSGRIADLLNA